MPTFTAASLRRRYGRLASVALATLEMAGDGSKSCFSAKKKTVQSLHLCSMNHELIIYFPMTLKDSRKAFRLRTRHCRCVSCNTGSRRWTSVDQYQAKMLLIKKKGNLHHEKFERAASDRLIQSLITRADRGTHPDQNTYTQAL